MIYSVADRVATLRAMDKQCHDRCWDEGRIAAQGQTLPRARQIGKEAMARYKQEAGPLHAELEALTAPVVGIAEHDGRLYLITERGAFELRDGALWLVPRADIPDALKQ